MSNAELKAAANELRPLGHKELLRMIRAEEKAGRTRGERMCILQEARHLARMDAGLVHSVATGARMVPRPY